MTTLAALNTPLREVRLYGVLAAKFGRVHHLAVRSAAEAVAALCAVLPGFEAHLRRYSEPGYHVCIGKRTKGHDLAVEELARPVGQAEPILLVPALAGAKRAGALQTIIGAVLIVGGVAFNAYTGGTAGTPFIKLGVSLMLGGVVQMITAPRKAETQQAEQTKSYGFDAVVNTDEEGLPVPVAIGRVFIGGARISAGLTADEYTVPVSAPIDPTTLPGYMPYDPIGQGGWGSGDAGVAGEGDGSDSDGGSPAAPGVGDA